MEFFPFFSIDRFFKYMNPPTVYSFSFILAEELALKSANIDRCDQAAVRKPR